MKDEKKSKLAQWLGEHQMDESPVENKQKTPLEIVELALRNELGIKNMAVDSVGGVIQFSIFGKNTDPKVKLTVNSKSRLVTIVAYFPFKTTEEKCESLMVLASLRNRKFSFGCDVAYEEFYSHEGYHFIPEKEPDLELVAYLVAGTIRSVDKAFPLVMKILHGGKKPKEVMAEDEEAREALKTKGDSNE